MMRWRSLSTGVNKYRSQIADNYTLIAVQGIRPHCCAPQRRLPLYHQSLFKCDWSIEFMVETTASKTLLQRLQVGWRGHTKVRDTRQIFESWMRGWSLRENVKGRRETESGKRTFDRLISTEGETCQISRWVWNWAVIAFSLHIQIQSCILITTTLQLVCLQHQSNLPPIKRTGRAEERGEENERSVRKVSLELQFFGGFLGFFLIFCKTLNNRSGIPCYLSGVTICNSLIWGFAFHLHISV